MLLSVSACRTRTPHTRDWLLTSAGVFRQCPPSIATTWLPAPLTTPTVRKTNPFFSSLALYGVQFFILLAVFVSLSLGEPQKCVWRVADRRHPGQSSGLSKCRTSVPSSRLVEGRVLAQTVRLKRKNKQTNKQACAEFRWIFYWLPTCKMSRVDEVWLEVVIVLPQL